MPNAECPSTTHTNCQHLTCALAGGWTALLHAFVSRRLHVQGSGLNRRRLTHLSFSCTYSVAGAQLLILSCLYSAKHQPHMSVCAALKAGSKTLLSLQPAAAGSSVQIIFQVCLRHYFSSCHPVHACLPCCCAGVAAAPITQWLPCRHTQQRSVLRGCAVWRPSQTGWSRLPSWY